MINNTNNKNSILENLIKNQIDIIEIKSKLYLPDLKRLTNNLSKDIFCDECSLWKGPILNTNNKEYISFFINGKKVTLNRILYKNYIGELEKKEYLKYSCINKGKCCTINHFYKVNKKEKEINNKNEEIVKIKKSNIVSF